MKPCRFYLALRGCLGAAPLETINGRVKGRLLKAGGRVRIGDALGGTMMRIARRVHLCMGPLRASAGLLVTFGHKSNRQCLKGLKGETLSVKISFQIVNKWLFN